MAQKKGEPKRTNAQMLKHNLDVRRLPKIDTTNASEVDKRVEEYFELCMENDAIPTKAGLAVALWTSRQTLYKNLTNMDKLPKKMQEVLERAVAVLEAIMQERLAEGKGHVVGEIFLMKNDFDGYEEKKEIIHTHEIPKLTREELLAKAAKLPGIEMKEED